MPRRVLHFAQHHLRVYDGNTDAIIGAIVALAAVEAVALVVITGVALVPVAIGWLAFAAVLIGLPWFWERLFGEDEEPSQKVHPWSGIPGT